jgi:DNA processing protein
LQFIDKRNISSISDAHRAQVLSLLSNTPVDIELISSHMQIPINVALCIIIELELAGKIIRYPGNKISINMGGF